MGISVGNDFDVAKFVDCGSFSPYIYVTRDENGSYSLTFPIGDEIEEEFRRCEVFKYKEIMLITLKETPYLLYDILNTILHKIRELDNFEIKDKSRITFTIEDIFKIYKFPREQVVFYMELFLMQGKICQIDENLFTFREREMQSKKSVDLQCPCGGILKHVGHGNMDLDTSHICIQCKTTYMYIDIPVIEALNAAYREKVMWGESYSFPEYCKNVIEIIKRTSSDDKRWKHNGRILSKREQEEMVTKHIAKQISTDARKPGVIID